MRQRFVFISLLVSLAGFGATGSALAQHYPPGFQDALVLSGLYQPTTFLFTPDGRMLIAERSGTIRVFQNGVLLSTAMATLPAVTSYEEGLLGMALVPGFPNPSNLYVCYTVDNGGTEHVNRVSRLALSGNSMVPGSETILFQNIPTGKHWHVAGCLRVAPDGNLFVSTGDTGNENRVQQLSLPQGKLLRLRPDGSAPPDNPFVGVAGALPEIYQLGLRNPFRFCLQPGTGLPFIGDVGYNSWEEVDFGPAGANFGWPVHEGQSNPADPAYRDPLFTYDHSLGSAAISGNTFYDGTAFPAEYRGNYFFFDHVRGTLGRIVLGPGNTLVSADPRWIETVSTGWGSGPVELVVAPDGALCYCVYSPGSIRRIFYTGVTNSDPTAVVSANPTAGYAPLDVQFDGSASYDLDHDVLTYDWDFGDGSQHSSLSNPLHRYPTNGTYDARLTVQDGHGGANTSAALRITVGNLPPEISVESPLAGSFFLVGQTIQFTGWARDPETGVLPGAATHWRVDLHHLNHFHPVIQDWTGFSGTFVADSRGESLRDISYIVTLWAEDSAQLHAERSVEIFPDPTQIVTVPPGISSSPPLTAQMGASYNYQAIASGEAPFDWRLPVAPGWLAVNSSGLVAGTPRAPGTYVVTLRAHNRGGYGEQTWNLVVGSASGAPRTVVLLGATWRYFKGSADPGVGWADPSHDDTLWLSGPSGFGYGDGDDATVLSDMQNSYTTVYTRCTFELLDVSRVREIALSYDYDDGFAAFLNGTRIFSQNAPANVTRTSLATASHEATHAMARTAFSDAATLGLLRDNLNVLAVVGLNVSLGSSDLTLRVALDVTEAVPSTPTDAGGGRGERLGLASPNPFRTGTTGVSFVVVRPGSARLEVFDAKGGHVRSLLSPLLSAGPHALTWDGHDDQGGPAPAGVYFYNLTAPGISLQGKLVRVR